MPTTHQCFVIVSVITIIKVCACFLRDFSLCHDNYKFNPADGVLEVHSFTWLGVINYIHVTTNDIHLSSAPRVVLVHKQFALGEAASLLHVPKHYKLGNITFGDYEQEESDCGLPQSQVNMGVTCARAYLIMPIASIITHPEYQGFGKQNSLAMVKLLHPLKSEYMVPICLPSVEERKFVKSKPVFMVDYISSVPYDFEYEVMAKRTLQLYTAFECVKDPQTRMGFGGVTNFLCTTGCGMRPGAALVLHAASGLFELVGISVSTSLCIEDEHRMALNDPPSVWMDVYPYRYWIINVVTAHIMPLPYPNRVKLTEQVEEGLGLNRMSLRQVRSERQEWRGHTYVAGNICFQTFPDIKQADLYKRRTYFYHETFNFEAEPYGGDLKILIEISSGFETTIRCVRIYLPNRRVTPKVIGFDPTSEQFNVSISMETKWMPKIFDFEITINGEKTAASKVASWNKKYNRQTYWGWAP